MHTIVNKTCHSVHPQLIADHPQLRSEASGRVTVRANASHVTSRSHNVSNIALNDYLHRQQLTFVNTSHASQLSKLQHRLRYHNVTR